MITGTIQSDQARISLQLTGQRGRVEVINAIVDSGFTGALTLPPSLIKSLELHWKSVDIAKLADGSTRMFRVYSGKVRWDAKVRRVLVAEADVDPLVGMKLLRGHELKMQVRAGGKVTIRRLAG